ncbi:hypothetical protein B0O80DRAFT_88782 [Mortierella sp. GBAus27b]|nr:hypothetical protein B0O80DRAFT_88782 [Mortierella sp. GBAus27b]
MDALTPAAGGPSEGDDSQNRTLLNLASANGESMSATGAHPALLGAATNVIDSDSNTGGSSSSTNTKALGATTQESYSPWDMPPIIQPVASNPETRPLSGLKGFSNLGTTTTWPHFRSKPHPTISVPPATVALPRSGFDAAAPSTPRSAAFSNPEDSDNAMCTPTFGSSSNISRRNSSVSVMALDTPPPFSLMDMESSSSLSGSSFGSGLGSGSGAQGSMSRSMDSGFGGINHGYPFPLFSMRHDVSGGLSRRSSRANSISMESRHVRKLSEDACMSDGGNNSGSERSRRHSPAVVSFERSVRRSALLPKPKGLLKVFTQLEEEIHHNRHEYDHEREITQVWKDPGEGPNMSTMETDGTRQGAPPVYSRGASRRPSSSSRLNPEQELDLFQRQQGGEYDKVYQVQQPQHPHGQPEQVQQQEHQALPLSPLPLQMPSPMQDTHDLDGSASSSFASHNSSIAMAHPSLQAPIVTRAKRKSSTCEERFDPYHSNQLKRRAVSPSIGPMISHRRSPSSSPARHIAGHSRSKVTALPSPSGTGTFFRHNHGLGGSTLGSTSGTHSAMESAGASGDEMSVSSRSSSGTTTNGSGNGAVVSSTLNLQNTSRSFSELSLDSYKMQ